MTLKQMVVNLTNIGIYLGMMMPKEYLDSKEKEIHMQTLVEVTQLLRKMIEEANENEKEGISDE